MVYMIVKTAKDPVHYYPEGLHTRMQLGPGECSATNYFMSEIQSIKSCSNFNFMLDSVLSANHSPS